LEAARRTAEEVGCGYVVPQFEDPKDGKDFNDLAVVYDLEEVRRQLENVQYPTKEESANNGKTTQKNGKSKQKTKAPKYRLVRNNLGDVTPKKFHWVVKDLIPDRAITLLQGHPGIGKSAFVCYLASKITLGGIWELDGNPVKKGKVMFYATEDAEDSTIVPRLIASGTINGYPGDRYLTLLDLNQGYKKHGLDNATMLRVQRDSNGVADFTWTG